MGVAEKVVQIHQHVPDRLREQKAGVQSGKGQVRQKWESSEGVLVVLIRLKKSAIISKGNKYEIVHP